MPVSEVAPWAEANGGCGGAGNIDFGGGEDGTDGSGVVRAQGLVWCEVRWDGMNVLRTVQQPMEARDGLVRSWVFFLCGGLDLCFAVGPCAGGLSDCVAFFDSPGLG